MSSILVVQITISIGSKKMTRKHAENTPTQGKDQEGADQVDRDHGQQLGGGGDRGEAGAGRPLRLSHLHTSGTLWMNPKVKDKFYYIHFLGDVRDGGDDVEW